MSLNRLSLAFAVVAVLASTIPLSATTYIMMADADLLAQVEDGAGAVVDARITSVEPAPEAGRPATDYTVEIERLLAGSAPGTTLIVRVPGGVRPDGIGFHVYGAPRFEAGNRALLFLLPREDGTFGILHLMLGAFHRVDLPATAPMAVRNLTEATELVAPGETPDPRSHHARDYDAFADWLADRAAGIEREPDYFVQGADTGRLFEKYTLFEAAGLNLRWFEFDTGGSVRWLMHRNDLLGLPDGGVSHFRTALASWGADPATPIRLVYGGRTSASRGLTSGGFDNLNVLLQGDPNQEIAGTFRCASGGGTLAIGGPWFSTNTQGTFRGRTFVRILGGDVVMNDGIECMRNTTSCYGLSIQEVYGHELGHALGLGHSCGDSSSPSCSSRPTLNDALMRANAHGDCRGASQNGDDLAAARFLYQLPSAGPSGPKAPTGVAGELVGASILLTWEDASSDEEGFRIYRSTNGGDFEQVGTASTDVEIFQDLSIAPATTYRYRIASFNGSGETQSAAVEVVVPPITPVTVALHEAPGEEIEVGEPVELMATFSGPARSADWSFGDGAVGFNDTRCDADTFCRMHVFTTPGPHVVEVALEGEFGQVARDEMTVQVADAPFDPAVEEQFLQWTIFGARGDTGTFESDVWLYNSGEAAALVELIFFPRGFQPASEPRTLTLAPSESLYLPNLLDKVFDVSAGQGSVGIRTLGTGGSTPAVLTISRAFVNQTNPAEGSFGQFVGGQAEGEWSADEKVVTGILDGDGFIATLLAANVDDEPGRVDMRLTDRHGDPVGDPASFALSAKRMRFMQLGVLFPDAAEREGPFTVRFTSDGVRFLASSTLLEVGSEDQIFIPAQEPVNAADIVVPRVVRSPGQFGVFLTTALTVLNNASVPTELTFQLLLRGQNNSEPMEASRTVPAGGVLFLEDVIDELFGEETATGALQIAWDNPQGTAPRVVAMILSENPRGDRFGMLVDSRPADAAASDTAVDFGSEQSDLFRSQYGVVSLFDGRTELDLTLRDANGGVLATRTLVLKQRQHLELNLGTIFEGMDTGRNWSVSTEVVAGGPVMTYLANINRSGDIFLVPGRARP
ncbi:MAG: hypothetical protein PVG07_07275 [Acidobacteriota bacterium]